jgi:hypothetical protein
MSREIATDCVVGTGGADSALERMPEQAVGIRSNAGPRLRSRTRT